MGNSQSLQKPPPPFMFGWDQKYPLGNIRSKTRRAQKQLEQNSWRIVYSPWALAVQSCSHNKYLPIEWSNSFIDLYFVANDLKVSQITPIPVLVHVERMELKYLVRAGIKSKQKLHKGKFQTHSWTRILSAWEDFRNEIYTFYKCDTNLKKIAKISARGGLFTQKNQVIPWESAKWAPRDKGCSEWKELGNLKIRITNMKTFKMKLHQKFPCGSNREMIYCPFKGNKRRWI